MTSRPPDGVERLDLLADCSRCAGLCCVIPAFAASSDFAIDKPSRTPCPHLAADAGCSIHADLPARGFPGCTVYDCFGAGQHVVQVQFGGAERAPEMYDAFEVVERLHELLWYLLDAGEHDLPRDLADEVAGAYDVVRAAVGAAPGVDVPAHQGRVGVLLGEVSTRVRAGLGGADHHGADLVGCDLSGVDLYAARLRGALLIGADLHGVDLGPADLLGADLRAADVRGADLSQTLFLTTAQARAARSDDTTVWPEWFRG